MRLSAWRFLVVFSLIFAGAPAEPAARPRYGGTLRVQMRSAPKSVDLTEDHLALLVFDRLVSLDENGQPQPSLALGWQHDAEKKHWQFSIRQASIDASALAELLGAAASDSSVVFAFDQPRPGLLFDLAGPSRSIFRRAPDGTLVGSGPFRVTAWDPGRRAVLAANQDHWGGRPFLDSIEIEFGKPHRDQAIDLELGKADVVEISPAELRRLTQRGTRTSTSRPVELLALLTAIEDSRLREAIALSLDRAAIHGVLFQKQGEIAGGLLPQWLSGYAHLFSTARDVQLASRRAAEARARPLVLAYDPSDPAARLVAERIAVNGREAGITLRVSPQSSGRADLTLLRRRITSTDPSSALVELAASLGLAVANTSTAEKMYEAERALVESFQVIPLAHLPQIYGLGPRVRNWRGWRLEDVWLEPEGP